MTAARRLAAVFLTRIKLSVTRIKRREDVPATRRSSFSRFNNAGRDDVVVMSCS
jgi:hypothetical protein